LETEKGEMPDQIDVLEAKNKKNRSSPWGDACRLDPAQFPGRQNADEEDNRKADTEGQRGGHVAFCGHLALNGWGTAPHHVHQGRAQAEQNGKKCDGNKNFHRHIIQ